jgi:lysozyme
MEISKKGILEIAQYEGASQTCYLDSVGVKTVGIGLTISDISDINLWPWSKMITLEQVFDMYTLSLQKYVDDVNLHVKSPLEQYQFDALCSVAYNIGSYGEDHSTFLKDINNKASTDEIVKAIKMWNKPKEIIGRRNKEANLFAKGIYSNNGMVDLIYVDPITHKEIPSKAREIDATKYVQ